MKTALLILALALGGCSTLAGQPIEQPIDQTFVFTNTSREQQAEQCIAYMKSKGYTGNVDFSIQSNMMIGATTCYIYKSNPSVAVAKAPTPTFDQSDAVRFDANAANLNNRPDIVN